MTTGYEGYKLLGWIIILVFMIPIVSFADYIGYKNHNERQERLTFIELLKNMR